MNIEHIKEQIVDYVTLGLPLERAITVAHISESERKALREDEEFQRDIFEAKLFEEIRLRREIKKTVEKAARIKLDYKGLYTMLEELIGEKETDTEERNVIILPSNGRD